MDPDNLEPPALNRRESGNSGLSLHSAGAQSFGIAATGYLDRMNQKSSDFVPVVVHTMTSRALSGAGAAIGKAGSMVKPGLKPIFETSPGETGLNAFLAQSKMFDEVVRASDRHHERAIAEFPSQIDQEKFVLNSKQKSVSELQKQHGELKQNEHFHIVKAKEFHDQAKKALSMKANLEWEIQGHEELIATKEEYHMMCTELNRGTYKPYAGNFTVAQLLNELRAETPEQWNAFSLEDLQGIAYRVDRLHWLESEHCPVRGQIKKIAKHPRRTNNEEGGTTQKDIEEYKVYLQRIVGFPTEGQLAGNTVPLVVPKGAVLDYSSVAAKAALEAAKSAAEQTLLQQGVGKRQREELLQQLFDNDDSGEPSAKRGKFSHPGQAATDTSSHSVEVEDSAKMAPTASNTQLVPNDTA